MQTVRARDLPMLVAGLGLVALGCAFLLANAVGLELHGNWWAIFIALPAVPALPAAMAASAAGNRNLAGIAFAVSLVVLTVAAIFLLQLPWSSAWPLTVTAVGIGLLLPLLIRVTKR